MDYERENRIERRMELEIRIGTIAIVALTWSPLPLLALGQPWLALGAFVLFLMIAWAFERLATGKL